MCIRDSYWCVNSKASKDDIQATLDFMNWCVTSDAGVNGLCKEMGFTIPFKANLDSDNVLVNEANKYLEDGKTPVSWNFSTMPSEEWKNGVGSALTAYAADQTDVYKRQESDPQFGFLQSFSDKKKEAFEDL